MKNLYECLEGPIRELDKTEFVKRYMQGIQEQAESSEGKIENLLTQIDITTIQDELLKYKKGQVGWASDLDYITNRLGYADLRKLIAASVTMWRRKCTTRGIKEFVRLLAGKEAIYETWFDFRTILGEMILGEEQLGYDPWIIGGQVSTYDEYTSNLRLMNDGNLDKRLLLDVIELNRIGSERIEVVVEDFLDTFDYGRDRWTTVYGTPATVVDGVFSLSPNTIEKPLITVVDEDTLSGYTVVNKFKVGKSGEIYGCMFYTDLVGNNFYELAIEIAETFAQIKLRRYTSGVDAVLVDTLSTFPVYYGVWYKARLVVQNIGSKVAIDFYLDSSLQFSHLDSSPSSQDGPVLFVNPGSNTENNEIDNVEIYRNPLKWAFLKPNGQVDYSESFWSL